MLTSSFLELRCKEVVNVVDGRRLGHIVDIVFDLPTGQVSGLVVPGDKNFWNVFKSGGELFIPYTQICKIGDDTILVELYSQTGKTNNAITFSKDTKKG
jgi:YlmC/YmxH family sporulation protein